MADKPNTPQNFMVIRSEDRESAFCAWDSVHPYVIEKSIWWRDDWTQVAGSGTAYLMQFGSGFVGMDPATYQVQFLEENEAGTGAKVAIIKDGFLKAYRDILYGAHPFAVWDGLRAYIYVIEIPPIRPVAGDIFELKVYYVEEQVPVPGADHYDVYATDRSNGLGYVVVAQVPNKAGVTKQFTVVDGLLPDQAYKFKVRAVSNMAEQSEDTNEASDF